MTDIPKFFSLKNMTGKYLNAAMIEICSVDIWNKNVNFKCKCNKCKVDYLVDAKIVYEIRNLLCKY